jgi:hypothetical protein
MRSLSSNMNKLFSGDIGKGKFEMILESEQEIDV